MKRLLGILLILILQIQSASAEEMTNAKSSTQEPECGDFSQVGFKDRDAFIKYVSDLKAAKSAEDFAKLVTFPLRINKKPKSVIIKDEAAFKQRFKEAFTDKTLEAIQKAERKDNFCNYQGITIGNGAVWIDRKGERTGIFVVNQ